MSWCGTLEKYDPIAVDTEGDSLHCYFEKLCLIQISLPEQDVLIDPLEPLDFSRFNAVLANGRSYCTAATSIYGCCGAVQSLVPGKVFDTYLAARLVGFKEVGLASLVKEFFDIELPKSSQKANWARRPLTPAMIEYAINDTLYLIDLAERLTEELRAKGRWEWFEESCQKAVLAAGRGSGERSGAHLEDIWERVTSRDRAGSFAGSLALAGCRGSESGSSKLSDPSERGADRAVEIGRGRNVLLPPAVHGTRRKRLESVLEEALLLPEAEWPQRVRVVRDRPTSEQEQRMEQLKNRRDRVAEGLQLDPGVVAPRQALERISREPEMVGSILMRWQKQLLGL